jgi:hypothetical protein
MNLEKGKWYKNLGYKNNFIGKYVDECNGDTKYVSEYINNKGKYDKYLGTLCFKKAVLINQNELNKYLPLGHADYKNIEIIELW